MKLRVEFFPSRDVKEIDLKEDATGMDLIEHLNLTPDSHILARSGKPVPVDDVLVDGETVTLISVVSGG